MQQMNYKKMDYPINLLSAMEAKGKLNLSPEYQRDYVYTQEQASKLIESALMNIPLPIIYLCEEGNGNYSVIDGQQRITSFIKYMRNEYSLNKLNVFANLNGKFYKDLDEELQDRIDNTVFITIIIAADSAESKFDIFERLNRGAVTLKEQELRNCVFRGPYNTMINEIAEKNTDVAKMFKGKNNRMWHQEYILRFFALRNFMQYKPSMKSFLNKYLKNNQYNDKDIQTDKDQFNKTLSTIKQVLGENAFAQVDYDKKIVLNKFSATFYDSIMVAFMQFDKIKLIQKADSIRIAIEDTKLHNDEYHDSCYAATGSKDRVIKRILTIYNLVNSILGDDALKTEIRTFDPMLKKPLAEKQNYICPLCGNKILSLDDCEIDHILPYSLGGKTEFSNAQLVHEICNKHKSNKIDINKVLLSVDAVETYSMNDDKNMTGKKLSMFTFNGKSYLVDRFCDMFIIILKDLFTVYPDKVKDIAEQGLRVTSKSKPYVASSTEGMIYPEEIASNIYLETNLDNNRFILLGRELFKLLNLDPSSVVLTLKGNEDDEQ